MFTAITTSHQRCISLVGIPLSYEGFNRKVLTTINIIITMEDELRRLHELLEIAQEKIHKLEREREELDWERVERFSECLEADNLFREKGDALETTREEVADIRKNIDSLLGP